MRFRIPRKTSVVLALLLVAALWLFGIWPLCTLGPGDACAISPAQRSADYWDELTTAWGEVRGALCPDDDAPCIVPDEDWEPSESVEDAFAAMSGLVDDVTPGGLVPRVFAEPTTLGLRVGADMVLSWPSHGRGATDGTPSPFRIGTLRLAAGASSTLIVLYRRQPLATGDPRPSCPATPLQIAQLGARSQPLGAGAVLRFAVPEATGASLVLCCTGADCRVEME